jgi:hypothetical protein
LALTPAEAVTADERAEALSDVPAVAELLAFASSLA